MKGGGGVHVRARGCMWKKSRWTQDVTLLYSRVFDRVNNENTEVCLCTTQTSTTPSSPCQTQPSSLYSITPIEKVPFNPLISIYEIARAKKPLTNNLSSVFENPLENWYQIYLGRWRAETDTEPRRSWSLRECVKWVFGEGDWFSLYDWLGLRGLWMGFLSM